MNILIISPVFPYPLDEGAKERIFQIIKGLSRQNKIHLITFFRNQNELQYLSELNKYCTRIDTVHNPPWSMLKTVLLNLLYILSPTPTLVRMHQSKEMRRRIEYALTNNHYDVVQIELTQMASYLSTIPSYTPLYPLLHTPLSPLNRGERGKDACISSPLKRGEGGVLPPATVLVEHDITFISRYRRLMSAPNPLIKLHWLIQYLKLRLFEITHCKKFDLIITVSEHDKTELQRYCPTSMISVVRTGVDIPSQSPLNTPLYPLLIEGKGACVLPSKKKGKGVCFLGSLSHWPNQDAVLYFYHSIFPLIKEHFGCHSEAKPKNLHNETLRYAQGDTREKLKKDIEFLIIGKGSEVLPTAIKEDKSVRLLGFVDDIKPLLEDTVSVAPIRYGSGTRSKILNYMACGSPVVSTSLGAEGLDVTHGENIIIADEPQEFAMAVANLMKDEELRKRIAIGGYNLVKEKYQWDKSIHELQNEYISLLKKKTP